MHVVNLLCFYRYRECMVMDEKRHTEKTEPFWTQQEAAKDGTDLVSTEDWRKGRKCLLDIAAHSFKESVNKEIWEICHRICQVYISTENLLKYGSLNNLKCVFSNWQEQGINLNNFVEFKMLNTAIMCFYIPLLGLNCLFNSLKLPLPIILTSSTHISDSKYIVCLHDCFTNAKTCPGYSIT